MARAGTGTRGAAALGTVLLLVLLAALTGCGGPPADRGGTERAVQRMLDRRAAALLDRDADAFLSTADPRATGYRAGQRRLFRNLAEVPLRSWQYRLVRTGGFEPARGDGRRVAAEVRLRYRLDGFDTAPVTAVQRLTVSERDGRSYVAAEEPRTADGRRSTRNLWDQGRVDAVRGRHSLVLGVGQEPDRLREIARTADRAVPEVNGAWPGRWARRVVLLVPGSLNGMGELLGAPADGYRGIAAVTTGEAGGAPHAPADRVIVNPDAYGVLGAFGRRVVLTHETTHVATRAATSSATPLWLSEGFADWAGYRGTGRTPEEGAPGLARAVRAGEAPRSLPSDEDFRFGGDPDRLGRAYESGWLACRMIAERWGADRLARFYRAVGAHEGRTGAVEAALRGTLRTDPEEFTALWRGYVRAWLG
ncbi:hypothetical protein ACFYYR_00015 [Streptomyces sp. NPDC001922]|uniref:hypothetical protein n=1 Tax=Streptomyces sp. NPDC001922 TaxID=3364624 RepID=UPI00367E2CD6